MNELKSISRNTHIREEEGANFSGNLSDMAPENAVKVTSLSDDVMEEFDRMKESILDIPMKDYYEGVIVNDRMAPECRKQILLTMIHTHHIKKDAIDRRWTRSGNMKREIP